MSLKEIHIGEFIRKCVAETDIEMPRICNFLSCTEKEVNEMYNQKSIDTEVLLRWSKLLKYDFFRLYVQHLILFSPPVTSLKDAKKTSLPKFRKNIYTKEIIEFVLELLENNEKTRLQIIDEYKIPKTTLYKWIEKYKK
ncbi:transposase [Chryseobacterium sp. PBS4-4]|uniref:Transposase n=1 Tax=Chryseobacterium edaphi TaxID=2976532 RepID=A0ABT2W1K1_9FLAO|nr:transposase [Chryseobacterium edaphi]MCU7615818.1 transposase [Chryseobacterium edaphi]